MVCSRVAIEPREDVARRRATHARERRQRNPAGDGEQHDAGDPERSRRELPHPKPRCGQKENDDREGKDQRRPHALDHEGAPRQCRERPKTAPLFGAE
jgi:hypothetical protein